jgi:hypothetical protein
MIVMSVSAATHPLSHTVTHLQMFNPAERNAS